jgi:hypothetical protein
MTDSAANDHYDRLTGSLGMRELAISALFAMSPAGTISVATSYDPTAQRSNALTPSEARESTRVISTRVAECKLEKELCCLELSPDGTALAVVEWTNVLPPRLKARSPSIDSFIYICWEG